MCNYLLSDQLHCIQKKFQNERKQNYTNMTLHCQGYPNKL
jgi:hypothetical protein